MSNSKKAIVLAALLFVGGCATGGEGASNVAMMLVSLPFKIIGAAVGAAVGAASGMGMMQVG